VIIIKARLLALLYHYVKTDSCGGETSTPKMEQTFEMSEYEKLRRDNIERNNEFLRALEIGKECGKQSELATNISGAIKRKREHTTKAQSAASIADTIKAPSLRRSSRSAGITSVDTVSHQISSSSSKQGRLETVPSFDFIVAEDAEDSDDGSNEERRSKVTASELRKLIDREDTKHSDRISNEVLKYYILLY
jgi:hypothetical protein